MNTFTLVVNEDGSGSLDGWNFEYIAKNSPQVEPGTYELDEQEASQWFIQNNVLKHE
jgi:hypothetical protein